MRKWKQHLIVAVGWGAITAAHANEAPDGPRPAKRASCQKRLVAIDFAALNSRWSRFTLDSQRSSYAHVLFPRGLLQVQSSLRSIIEWDAKSEIAIRFKRVKTATDDGFALFLEDLKLAVAPPADLSELWKRLADRPPESAAPAQALSATLLKNGLAFVALPMSGRAGWSLDFDHRLRPDPRFTPPLNEGILVHTQGEPIDMENKIYFVLAPEVLNVESESVFARNDHGSEGWTDLSRGDLAAMKPGKAQVKVIFLPGSGLDYRLIEKVIVGPGAIYDQELLRLPGVIAQHLRSLPTVWLDESGPRYQVVRDGGQWTLREALGPE